MTNFTIVPCLSSHKEFYIFRNSGEEVKVLINAYNTIKSVRYKLTKDELEGIKKYINPPKHNLNA